MINAQDLGSSRLLQRSLLQIASRCRPGSLTCPDGTVHFPDISSRCKFPKFTECSEDKTCPYYIPEEPKTGDICTRWEGPCYYGWQNCCDTTFLTISCSCNNGIVECVNLENPCLGECPP